MHSTRVAHGSPNPTKSNLADDPNRGVVAADHGPSEGLLPLLSLFFLGKMFYFILSLIYFMKLLF